MGDRFLDDGATLDSWAEPEVWVVCPRCGHRAVVRRAADDPTRRLTCAGCGLARETAGSTSSWGGPVDPWFREPLWLQGPFRDHTVWAYNDRHLARLRAFLAAGHRERRPGSGAPMSMVEKLPGWLTSAHHRTGVLAALDRLERRALE